MRTQEQHGVGSSSRQAWLERLGVVVLAGLVLLWTARGLVAVGLLTGSLLAAVLLTALLAPLAAGLRRLGLPRAASAAAATLALLAALVGVAVLVYRRAAAQVDTLPALVVSALDDARAWLVDGPLQLDPQQVRQLRDAAAGFLLEAVPTPLGGATAALRVMSAAVLALFAVFFLLKDGPEMWRWALSRLPEHRRHRTDRAGAAAWQALSGYVSGVTVVAAVDAMAIGGVLLVLGVPLWLSLGLLTFLGAYVPLLGAFVVGALAVLVALATEGARDAAVVLVAVVLVEQLEGNVLHPVVVGRAVRLHPLVVLVAVTAGVLLHGVAGALVAVPLVAVAHRVADALHQPQDGAQRLPERPLPPQRPVVATPRLRVAGRRTRPAPALRGIRHRGPGDTAAPGLGAVRGVTGATTPPERGASTASHCEVRRPSAATARAERG